ncbi:DUF427 domain-containing protein [Streptomyces flavidovirens]|uniref:DUF427 domain-containing protein n=1 Tax=Streptomyces flavidovirens TaxID=67298 RepID=UPI000414D05A|nr:DUF427 domain-containing protein [Streptomyces flavidovirens]
MERQGDRGGPAYGDRGGQGNHYFPPESLDWQYVRASKTRSLCFWKGIAHYYSLEVDGRTNPNAAWYYPKPSPLARKIKDHVAFWQGVCVEGTPELDLPSDGGK